MGTEWGGGCSKTNKSKQGGSGAQNSWILSERTFWMTPNIDDDDHVYHDDFSRYKKLFMNFNFKHNFNKLWDMKPLNFVKIMITFSYGARKCKQSCRMLTKISLLVLIHKIWIKVSRNWQELENTVENYVI